MKVILEKNKKASGNLVLGEIFVHSATEVNEHETENVLQRSFFRFC